MSFPLKVTCHHCSASLLVREPALRGRCNNCGAVIELTASIGEVADLPVAAPPSSVVREACSAVAAPAPATTCAVEPVAVTGRSGRRRLVVGTVATCGVIAATCLYLYWPTQQLPPPDSVVVENTPQMPEPPAVIKPESGVIIETPKETPPGTGLGQLDSLLLTAQAFSGSWLTGIGSAGNEIHAPCPTLGGNQIPIDTSAPPPEYGLVVQNPQWKTPGPLSNPPPEFGYEIIDIPNLKNTPLGIAKNIVEDLGLVFICNDPHANFQTDVVVQYTPDKASHKKTVQITGVGTPVPNVLTLPIAAADEAMRNAGFQPIYDSSISTHHLVSLQYPVAGAVAVRGSPVEFASLSQMPPVEGLAIAEAAQILKADDIYFTWWRNDYDSNRWPGDVVCSQSIPSGMPVIRGVKYIGNGKVPTAKLWAGVRVPAIVGMTGEIAKAQLEQLGIEWRAKINRPVRRTDRRYVGIDGRDERSADGRVFRLANSHVGSALEATIVNGSKQKHILAQFGGGGAAQNRDVFVRSENQNDGPELVVRQDPQAGKILCRGRTLLVQVEQPMIRVEYYRNELVPADDQGGGSGQGGGGLGGGGGGGFF